MRRLAFVAFIAAASAMCLLGAACKGRDNEPSALPRTGGDPARGEMVILTHGCGACHTIPGIRGARGLVAQPLTFWSKRTFIAGELPNTPDNLVRWVMDPRAIRPKTAMPNLGLDMQEARDVAAYLYTLD